LEIWYSFSKESLISINYKNLHKLLKICLGRNKYYLRMISRLTALVVVAISVMISVGPLAATGQEMIADNDALLQNSSLPNAPNNEQNPTLGQTDVPESNDAVDLILRQIPQLSTVAPDVDIENSTATEIGDLLELYGLDTEGPVCPPCP
jgi:hypothetical protein